ncbi:hypothetical protein TL16_g06475 [Triparma laevis f. inornata]|uniref:Uncharacterized protein n=1 Tax=Triparma laevis f. inornata TaxID=1714386 RepID=A0A9W7ALI3_9STRA|nr:hypothetical protein TL16_g06475 [Triparma laevis f. inornata]
MASSTSVTWEFDAHLNSTTHHGHPIYNNPTSDCNVTSWISFWRDKTGKDVPKFCPGVHPSDDRFATHAHEFGYKISGFKKVVGAHVRIKDATGNVRNTDRGRGKHQGLSITGVTNKNKTVTSIYHDPDDFLHALCMVLRNRLSGRRARLCEDKDFIAEVIECNVNILPKGTGDEYPGESPHKVDPSTLPKLPSSSKKAAKEDVKREPLPEDIVSSIKNLTEARFIWSTAPRNSGQFLGIGEVLTLPATLSSYQRSNAHRISEEYKLEHVTRRDPPPDVLVITNSLSDEEHKAFIEQKRQGTTTMAAKPTTLSEEQRLRIDESKAKAARLKEEEKRAAVEDATEKMAASNLSPSK